MRSIYLRGGAVFIALAVLGSLVLTASASSAPLASVWRGVDRTLVEWSQDLQRFLPLGGTPRSLGFQFGNQAKVFGVWQPNNGVAATVQLPAGFEDKVYWRTVTFDYFQFPDTWRWSEPRAVDRAANDAILEGLGEEPTEAFGRERLEFTVELEGWNGDFLISPQDPVAVDQAATVQVVGSRSWLAAVEVPAQRYTIAASLPVIGESGNGLTGNRLAAAGRDYPEEIRRLYLQREPGTVGPSARDLLEEVQGQAGTNPYNLAYALEQHLRNDASFRYNSNVLGLCDGMSTAECFARHRQGFCLHYASTMALLLREASIPSRLVMGFLPGTRDPATNTETIRANSAHAWVEVYFPGFGWYAFDPTGGGRAQRQALPSGPPVTPAPSARESFGPVQSIPREDDEANQGPNRDGNSDVGSGSTAGNDGSPVLGIVALLLLTAVGAIAFAAWRRGPRGEVTADGVWRGVTRTAGRLGFAPRPQQTVYEYAGTLSDVLPAHRPELHAVARAKVEVAYGGRDLTDEARRTLRDAQRRLRVGLLRLALRRRERRRRR